MNSHEFNGRMLDVVKGIRDAETEYQKRIEQAANTDRRYKRLEAEAFLHAEGKNVTEREAKAEQVKFEGGFTLGDVRYEAKLAAGLQDSAKLALRARTQELSALQSLASLAKAETNFAQYGPDDGP